VSDALLPFDMRSPSSGDAGGHLNSMQERTDAVERSGSPYFQGLNTASIASGPIANNYLANAGGLRAGFSAASRGATAHRGVCVPNLSLAGRSNSKQFKQFVLIFKLGAGILFTSHNLELQLASKRLRNRGAMVGGL
jgi:hypothetical protein